MTAGDMCHTSDTCLKRWPATASLFTLYTLLGTAIYWNVIANGAFLMDDLDYIVNNPAVKDLPSSAGNVWEPRYFGFLTFALNYYYSGANPVPFHTANVLIHILAACTAFLLAQRILSFGFAASSRLGQSPQHQIWLPAAFVGILFLVHPLATQAVSYASQRFTSLASLFYMASCLTYLNFRSRAERNECLATCLVPYLGSFLFAILALKTKEISFSLPFLLIFTEMTLLRSSRFGRNRILFAFPHMAAATLVPLSIFAGDLGLSRETEGLLVSMVLAKQDDLLNLSPYLYFINQIRVVNLYLRLLILPVQQKAQYDFEAASSLLDPRVLGCAAVLLAIALAGGWLVRRARQPSGPNRDLHLATAFGIGWFFITLSVESSFIPIKHLVFEQRVYLPSFGFLLAATAAGAFLARSLPSRPLRILLPAVATIAVATLSSLTYLRNIVWTDPVLFWTDVAEKSPGLLAGWHNRAIEYRNQERYDLAMADLDQGVRHFHSSFQRRTAWPDPDLNPENAAKVFGVRAKISLILGNVERALQDFRQVAALARISNNLPFVSAVMTDIAIQFDTAGLLQNAIDQYTTILEVNPTDTMIRQRRGSALINSGFYERALQDLNIVVELNPSQAPAYYLRSLAWEHLGGAEAAHSDLQHACDLGFPPACIALGKPIPFGSSDG